MTVAFFLIWYLVQFGTKLASEDNAVVKARDAAGMEDAQTKDVVSATAMEGARIGSKHDPWRSTTV